METIAEQCMFCKEIYELKVHPKDIERIDDGEHIQDVMPYLSDDERELMISGICGKCFDETFEDEGD